MCRLTLLLLAALFAGIAVGLELGRLTWAHIEAEERERREAEYSFPQDGGMTGVANG